MRTKKAVIGVLTCFCLFFLMADETEQQEQLVYYTMSFNGKDYVPAFCRQPSDTLYMPANVDNFINLQKTLVYFWPLENAWKTNTKALNQFLDGILQVKGKDFEANLKGTYFTYYNEPGLFELNFKVLLGEEAQQAYQEYSQRLSEYMAREEIYNQLNLEYENKIQELTLEAEDVKDKGEQAVNEFKKKVKEFEKTAPVNPQPLPFHLQPLRYAYNINLPQGEYAIRLLDENGNIYEGSEKKIVVFEKHRTNSTGYEVIPSDKWTRPQQSRTPSSVLYVNGKTDLYIQPYYQDEVNDLYYNKMADNDGRGNPNILTWVRIQQIPMVQIELSVENKTTVLTEQPYVIDQSASSALGYKIVPFDPQSVNAAKGWDLVAFHIPIQPDSPNMKFKVLAKNDESFATSMREIRVIKQYNPTAGLLFLFLTLFFVGGAGALVIMLRYRTYSLE